MGLYRYVRDKQKCLHLVQGSPVEAPDEEISPLEPLDSATELPAAFEAAAAGAQPEEASEPAEEAAPVAEEEKGWKLTPEGDAAVLQGEQCFQFLPMLSRIQLCHYLL